MIDIKLIRENSDLVKENIMKKFQEHKLTLVDEVLELDIKNRQTKLNGDELRMQRKNLSEQIGNLMKSGNIDEAKVLLSEATKKIDQACTKGVIVKNTAARKKSSLSKKLNAAMA